MNQRLALYIFRNILTAFLFTGVVIAFVVLFVQSLKLLSFVMDNAGTALIFCELMGLMLPAFLPMLVPISLGVGILFVYHKFAVDSELVVMRAAGIDPWYLAKPALVLGMVGVLVGYVLTLWITPMANSELVDLQYKVRNHYSLALVKAGTFNDLAEGLTFYVRARGKSGELLDLLIHDVRKPDAPVTVMAESGQFTSTEGEPQIVAFKGKRQEINKLTGHLSQLNFDRYVLDLQTLRNNKNDRLPDPREMSLTELLHPPLNPSKRHSSLEVMRAEVHQRIALPFLALSYALIGLTAILVGVFNRRGMSHRILIAAAAMTVVQIATLSLGNWMGKQPFLTPLFYAVVLAPVPICALLLSAPVWRPRLRRLRLFASASPC